MWGHLHWAWTRWGVARRIRRQGWSIMYVDADPSLAGEPCGSFAYSIGFQQAFASPEIILFGSSIEIANRIIKIAASHIHAGVLALADGIEWTPGPNETPPLVWREVHPQQINREYLTLARWWNLRQNGPPLRAFQLVLPDAEGHAPWDEDCDPRLRERQPELWRPPSPWSD